MISDFVSKKHVTMPFFVYFKFYNSTTAQGHWSENLINRIRKHFENIKRNPGKNEKTKA